MQRSTSIQKMTASALLIAIGIVIPLFMPIKIVLEPASFTLASHVAIFIAMMLSPGMAAAVALGTTLGFFLSGFPLVVVLRAASHLLFAVLGAVYVQKRPEVLSSPVKNRLLSLTIGVIHAMGEVAVASAFYFGGHMGEGYYQQGYVQSIMLLVGLGTIVHSMVDYEIALVIYKILSKQKSFSVLTSRKQSRQ